MPVLGYAKTFLNKGFPARQKETPPEAAYDLWAATYDLQPDNLVLALDQDIFSLLLAPLSLRGTKMIDVGCGTGRHWSMLLKQCPASLTGYDVSEEMLRIVKQKYPGHHAERLTGIRLNQPDAGCDLLVSTLALAHIPDMPGTLTEWCRVLKPGGDMIITDYHPAALQKGGNRTFQYQGQTVAVQNYIHPIDSVIAQAELLNLSVSHFMERTIDEEVRHWYEKQHALTVYEKFKGTPIVYGLHLKKYDVTP